MTEWYRRTTWTKVDEEEFFAKLKRARQGSRPQYLMIQASTLTGTTDPVLLDAAEFLILKLLADYPDNKFERSSSLGLLGDIYRYRQQYDTAISYYKNAIDFEKEYPQVQTGVFLEFAELVVKLDKREYFDFVEQTLSEKQEEYPFPLYKYKIFSLLAIINKIRGNTEVADRFAERADEYAAAKTSGFRYHPSVGIVTERDPDLDERMKKDL